MPRLVSTTSSLGGGFLTYEYGDIAAGPVLTLYTNAVTSVSAAVCIVGAPVCESWYGRWA